MKIGDTNKTREKESAGVLITQKIRKERENSYQKMKRQTQTHRSSIETFQ